MDETSEKTFEKSILEMAQGGFLEQVDYKMSDIIENILDPNTKATGKRQITVTMELIPDDSRRQIVVRFSTKLKLVEANPLTTSLYIAGDAITGEVRVVEMVPQIPGQMALDGTEQEGPPKLRIIKFA